MQVVSARCMRGSATGLQQRTQRTAPLPSVGARPIRPRVVVLTRANPIEGFINSLNEGKKMLAKSQAGQYDEASVRATVDRYIADNKVVVFSWSGCPYCTKAKALLTEIKADYVAVEIDRMGDEGKAIRVELAQMTNRTSMPNVWIAGKSVGGCNDGPGVMTLYNEGKLLPMLKAAGAL